MTTLSTLSTTAQSAVDALCSKIENKKDWTLSTIVEVYALDASITPQHLLAGVKKKSSIGEIFGAWYIHKSGIASSALNIRFIAENYASIRVLDTAEAMADELKQVGKAVVAAKAAADRTAAERGESLTNALTDLSKEFDAVAQTIMVPSAKSDELIMALQTKLDTLVSRYKTVANLNQSIQRESVLTNA